MKRSRSPFVLAVAAALFLAAGCSVPRVIDQSMGAGKALREGDDAAADGDYDAALGSYLKAKRLLLAARQQGYRFLSDDGKLAAVDDRIKGCERLANEDGLVRVGDRYVGADKLGGALAESLQRLFRGNPAGAHARERVVPEEVEASCIGEADGRFDVTVRLVVRDAEDEGDFDQDVWGLVRFLMEGAWGHGFCSYSARRYALRPWMGEETRWGSSRKANAENRFVGLKDRINRLTIVVSRGRLGQEPGDGYGPRGHAGLSAIGPYWRKEPYRSYALGSVDAARLNWSEANRIPDSTLYGLIGIEPETKPGEADGGGGAEGSRGNG